MQYYIHEGKITKIEPTIGDNSEYYGLYFDKEVGYWMSRHISKYISNDIFGICKDIDNQMEISFCVYYWKERLTNNQITALYELLSEAFENDDMDEIYNITMIIKNFIDESIKIIKDVTQSIFTEDVY